MLIGDLQRLVIAILSFLLYADMVKPSLERVRPKPAHEGLPDSTHTADGSTTGTGVPMRPLSTAITSSKGLQPPARVLSHRLSFDPATGVITLPDGEVFYERVENGADSDSDYGEVSGETDSHVEQSGEVSPVVQGADDSTAANGGQTASSLRAKRHSTYFHHPERRRHQVPGAFPA